MCGYICVLIQRLLNGLSLYKKSQKIVIWTLWMRKKIRWYGTDKILPLFVQNRELRTIIRF